jgi:DNA/RNA endonuclease G (NUC1)
LPSRALPHHQAWIIVKWAARPAEARKRWFAKPIRLITTCGLLPGRCSNGTYRYLAAPEVELPSGYWKIIFIGSSPDKGEYAAFLLDQATPKSASFCDYQVTVEEIERRTHPALSFWSALPAGIARRLKSRKGSLAKEMGCP